MANLLLMCSAAGNGHRFRLEEDLALDVLQAGMLAVYVYVLRDSNFGTGNEDWCENMIIQEWIAKNAQKKTRRRRILLVDPRVRDCLGSSDRRLPCRLMIDDPSSGPVCQYCMRLSANRLCNAKLWNLGLVFKDARTRMVLRITMRIIHLKLGCCLQLKFLGALSIVCSW
jgi:hypothetical protein